MQKYTIIASGTLTDREAKPDDEFDMTEPKTEVYMIDIERGAAIEHGTCEHIRDRFRSRCSCAHDCCGHRNGGVSAIARMWEGRYLVTVQTALNY